MKLKKIFDVSSASWDWENQQEGIIGEEKDSIVYLSIYD